MKYYLSILLLLVVGCGEKEQSEESEAIAALEKLGTHMKKDEDGNVPIEPRNFFTTGMKKGKAGRGTYFEPHPEWKPEDPTYKQKMIRAEMAKHKSAMPPDAPAFS